MISIVLIEPEKSGNVGAVARVMKNFGFESLVLIHPRCKPYSIEAYKRAKHAKDLLDAMLIEGFSYLEKFDYLVATTSQLGTDYNIPRSPITVEQLAEKLNATNLKQLKIGILIGREGIGLKNEEILRCDFMATIPSSPVYPVLNLSQSVGIILYELFKHSDNKKSNKHILFATKKEKDIILKYLGASFDQVKFSTKEKKETQRRVWRRIVGKSFMTKREAFAVIGFLKKLVSR